MRHLSIHPADGTDADAFLCDDEGIHAVAHTPDVAAATVVARQQHLVYHHAAAETCAEGDAHHVLVATLAASLLQSFVHSGQGTCQSFAVGKEVAVVVHIHRNLEDALQVRTERYAASEGGEVGQVADDATLVVCRAGEGEADGNRLYAKFLLDGGEALHKGSQAALGVGGDSLQANRFHNLLIVANGGENEVCAARIKRQHNFLVFTHNVRFYWFRYYVMSL